MITSGLLAVLVLIAGVLLFLSRRIRIRISDLWRCDGTIDRGPYAFIGALGFALKHNLDRAVASFAFHRPWGPFNYWIPPTRAVHVTTLSKSDAAFLTTMLLLSLPFIWVGVALTLRRLRSAGLPPWLVIVFFLPVINLAFFAILSILPSRDERIQSTAQPKGVLHRLIPDHTVGSAAMALLLTVPFAAAITKLGVSGFGAYGWGLFVALPFSLGLASVLLYGYHRPRDYAGCLLVSSLSILLLGGVLLAVAFEGIICLIMALPIGLVLAVLGGSVGYLIQSRAWGSVQAPSMMLVLVFIVPALMAAEYATPVNPPVHVVRTAIEIDAVPERVWPRLVSFPKLPDPVDWIFRLGIAYPIQATIHGGGPGALRECLFSTGTFLERIDAWEEQRLLRFSVSSKPPGMRELSPYLDIHPRHLDGYLRPKQAEFTLTPLPGGRTRLEGTSVYTNDMWPAGYWQLWSDWIVHRVHRRVFEHIKRLAEAGS